VPVIEAPDTLYARTADGGYLAYQVLGDGPMDLVFQLNGGMLLDLMWEEPAIGSFMRRLATFSRVITFDARGFGSSGHLDPRSVPAIQTWMDDIGTVMGAAGSTEAALLACGETSLAAMLFAATYPQRVLSLSLINSFARYQRSEECRWGMPARSIPAYAELVRELWGTGGVAELLMPSLVDSVEAKRRWGLRERLSATPDSVVIPRAFWESDVTGVLSTIQAPTLVISREGDRHVRSQHGPYLASRIPGAKLVELPGWDHWPFSGRSDEILSEVEEFMTGARPSDALDRVLATVLFTDIVSSTERAIELGDRQWREALNRYDDLVRRHLERYRGRQVKMTGDGTLAVFDGPARAVECARALSQAVGPLGFEIRAGLHTGEIETRGDDVAGVAVHIAARVLALGGPGEVLVSRTVTDLVVGSGIEFEDRGDHELKGLPGSWRLFEVRR
jgi:class 3 adenylate cyclase/pimeloyl-ACP methyl ester carboxylesterase